MGDGLPWVRQHLVPVVPAQALGVDAHPTDSDDLVVAHSGGGTKGMAWGTRHALGKGGPDSALRALGRDVWRGRRLPAAAKLCPASLGRHCTQRDEQEVINSFGASGNGGQMAGLSGLGELHSLLILDSACTSHPRWREASASGNKSAGSKHPFPTPPAAGVCFTHSARAPVLTQTCSLPSTYYAQTLVLKTPDGGYTAWLPVPSAEVATTGGRSPSS